MTRTPKTPTALDVVNKIVLIRADYNVPLRASGRGWVVADDERIRASIPTIHFLREHGARVVLLSHLGRPDGKPSAETSLKPIAKRLSELLQQVVELAPDCIGQTVQQQVNQLEPGEVLLLENLRWHAEEESNGVNFAKQLAALGDIYIDEAFSTAHRSHASIVGIPQYLPSFAGFALAKEVEMLSKLMVSPKRPFVMVVGGAKIADKVGAIVHLAGIADAVLVGGGVANNFLKADGIDIADSYVQDQPVDGKQKKTSYVDVAENLMEENRSRKMLLHGYIPIPKIITPIDVTAAPSVESRGTEVVTLTRGDLLDVPDNLRFMDIGPKTRRLYREILLQAETIFWNGPMGVFEEKLFSEGTHEVARTIAKAGATTILGGGDTISAIHAFGLEGRYDYVSAAGGAALEFLSGAKLPGLEVLG